MPAPTNPIEELAERERTEDRLRESEERFRTLFESMDEGFCVIEVLFDDSGRATDYRFLEANPAFEKHTGLAGVVGKTMRELVPDHDEHWFETYGRIAVSGEPMRFVNQGEALGRWWDVYAFRLGGESSRKVAVLFNDITARKRAELELQEAARRKDEFLATLAHELRNPLAPIRNGLQILRIARDDAEVAEQALAMMERQVGQMVRLIDDLMDLSRVNRGQIELRKSRVELAAVVDQAVEASRPLIEERRHLFAIEIEGSPLVVDADTTRLAQVFSNLLNNAAKYTEPGGQIRFRVVRRGGEAVIAVSDNGMGIPPEMLQAVFEIFTQVDQNLEKTQGGLGIGLSLVKKLVEMHGGTVEARSAGRQRGSEFVVTVPLAPEGAEG